MVIQRLALFSRVSHQEPLAPDGGLPWMVPQTEALVGLVLGFIGSLSQ